MVVGGGWEERTVGESGMDTYILLCLKWIADRTSCIARETLLNVAWWPGWEGSLGEWIHVYL